jgi:Fur family zinc uptake transcriptional regulator
MELKEAVGQIRAAGHKLTPQRMEILRVLIAAGAPVTAQAVLTRVKETYPYISLDTVYRNLAMLSNTGLVNQINLQNKGTAEFEFQGEAHHHHAICLECGRSFCVDACPLPRVVPLPAGDQNFRVVSHAFEIYGYCSQCQHQTDRAG